MSPEQMWDEYAAATGFDGDFDVDTFGDTPELRDELLALVLDGTKRATASAARDYEGEPLPSPGQHWVVTDGRDEAACICRNVSSTVGRLGDVTPAFAWAEGEGDRTVDDWLRDHLDFFTRDAAASGLPDEGLDLDVVFERFAVVWPPEHADAADGVRGELDPFDLTDSYLHLRPGTGAAVLPGGEAFWASLDDRQHLHEGRLVGIFPCDVDWPHWERHPAGGELVHLLDGAVDLIVELPDGERTVELRGRQGVVVPPGLWHRAVVHQAGHLLTITPGAGTEHRPV